MERTPQQMGTAGRAPAEHALMARVMRGDETALAELYDRFGSLVYAIALRITQDRLVAEEVVQDVFHAVWRSAGGFQHGASAASWIIGIARHRAIDATRARGFRARAREYEIDTSRVDRAADLHDRHVELLVLREEVRAALRQLDPLQREALGLAYYAGMSHVEIAAHTGTPVGTVKSRLRLGLLRLRRELSAPAV